MAQTFDAMFANSQAETKTTTEKGFIEGFAKQIGDIGSIMIAILVAVLFTILLVVGNTMAQAVRERTSELAVLKTLGFSDVAVLCLVLAESLFVALVGGGLGLLAAWLIVLGRRPDRRLPAGLHLPGRDIVHRRRADGRRRAHRRHPAGGRRHAAEDHRRAAQGVRTRHVLLHADFLGRLAQRADHPPALGSSAVAVVGIAGVVIVFVAVLSIAEGFQVAMKSAGQPDRALIMRGGAERRDDRAASPATRSR